MDEDRGHPHLLLWYVSGDLDPAQAQETEAHLAHCRDCTDEAKTLASMLKNLKDGVAEELPDLTALRHPVDVRPALTHSNLLPGDRANTQAPRWRRRLPALIACAATVTLVVIGVPALVRTLGGDTRQSSVREVQSVVLAPPERGAGNAKVLTGSGPWAISVVLPFGAPAGLYDLRIEAVDQPAHPVLNTSLPADVEGRLSVIVESLSRPGRFVMSVRLRESAATTPYVYAFQTVAGATDGA